MRQTKRQNAKAPVAPVALQAADDDAASENIDDFRNELARRINRFIADRQEYWRGCQERACRRRRACAALRIDCSNAPPLPPMKPEQEAQAIAQVQRALREIEAQREQGA